MKLVRDYIPELYPDNVYRRSTRGEWRELIRAKLLEEAKEVTEAEGYDDIAEELGDLLEVMYAYARIFNIDFSDVASARVEKRLVKGKFRKGYVMLEEGE